MKKKITIEIVKNNHENTGNILNQGTVIFVEKFIKKNIFEELSKTRYKKSRCFSQYRLNINTESIALAVIINFFCHCLKTSVFALIF